MHPVIPSLPSSKDHREFSVSSHSSRMKWKEILIESAGTLSNFFSRTEQFSQTALHGCHKSTKFTSVTCNNWDCMCTSCIAHSCRTPILGVQRKCTNDEKEPDQSSLYFLRMPMKPSKHVIFFSFCLNCTHARVKHWILTSMQCYDRSMDLGVSQRIASSAHNGTPPDHVCAFQTGIADFNGPLPLATPRKFHAKRGGQSLRPRQSPWQTYCMKLGGGGRSLGAVQAFDTGFSWTPFLDDLSRYPCIVTTSADENRNSCSLQRKEWR